MHPAFSTPLTQTLGCEYPLIQTAMGWVATSKLVTASIQAGAFGFLAAAVMDAVELAFVNQGFSVSRNMPFAGAYIVQEYGRPSVGQHAVQVELDRSLYMDEACIQKHEGFEQTRLRLRAVVQELILIEAMGLPVAAQ